MPVIGIDLGTSNSCVAVYRKDQVEIIENDQGHRLTPSFVSFTEYGRLIGTVAKEETSNNFENTLFQIKRLIGRRYDDPTVQSDMKRWGFRVINDNNKPKIQVTQSDRRMVLCPEEVSSMILASLKEAAEDRLGEPVKDAVITVPAYFNDAQRSATRDAGTIAGLNVIRMINEPTAAAIAYGLDRQNEGDKNVLIFDLGGGTFDVTIVNIKGKIFDVIATGGDTHLGGDDFDNRMVDYLIEEFNRKNKCDMSKNKRGMHRLRDECEAAKMKLSVCMRAKIQVDGLHNGIDFRSDLSRAKFEELNRDLFEKTINTVKDVMSDANMTKSEIDNVVLVGGSTRIPKIQELLQEYFEGKTISKAINPDEAVAHGAAALAANLSPDECSDHIKELKLQDVTPITLGWRSYRGEMVQMIMKNTKLPAEAFGIGCTAKDNQTTVRFNVYEGERAAAADNHFLGEFDVKDIPSAPREVEKFKIHFSVDVSGILTVKAKNLSSEKENQIVIGSKGRLSETEIKNMAVKAKNFRKKDEAFKKRAKQVHKLEDFVYGVKHAVEGEKFREKISSEDKKKIFDQCGEIIDWLDSNRNPEVHKSEDKENELESMCRPIFGKVPGGFDFLRKLQH